LRRFGIRRQIAISGPADDADVERHAVPVEPDVEPQRDLQPAAGVRLTDIAARPKQHPVEAFPVQPPDHRRLRIAEDKRPARRAACAR
jgi:hypothetical protein